MDLTLRTHSIWQSYWRQIALSFICVLPLVAFAQPAPPSNLSGTTLRTWLKTNWYDGRLNSLSYANARRKMYNIIDNESTGPNANKVVCVYSGYEKAVNYGGTSSNPTPINCEHTVPQSFFSSNAPMVSDIHHLFPTMDEWNTTRSNHKFNGLAVGSVTKWMTGSTSTTTAPAIGVRDNYSKYGGSRFEPRRAHKGNLARAIMYFYTMYPTEAGPMSDVINVDTMYAWHIQDPVDANERTRNDRVESQQGNRNPYIDYPEISARAWGINVCSGTPSAQASAISSTNLLANSLTLSWTNNSGDKVLVIARSGSAVSTSPSGAYSTGVSNNFGAATDIGAGNKVVYNGVSNTVNITGLTANTTYHFAVFAYCSNGNAYRTPGLTSSATTPTCSGNPSIQASNLSSNSIGSTTASLAFDAGNGNARMVVLREGATVNWTPTQGSTYTGNANFSSATDQSNGNKVIYLGSGNTVDITNLTANKTYYARVYELCNAGTPAFTISSPPSTSFQTTVACAGGSFTQASTLQASGMAETGGTLRFVAGNGTNRLVVLRQDAPTSWTPTDGNTYTANSNFSSATDQGSGNKVVYDGTGTQVVISGMLPASRYYASVFEWCSVDNKYNLTSPSTTSFLTLGGSDLIISEYVEGGGSNRGLELYNPTGAQVDLSEYSIKVYLNGNATASTSTSLAGILDDGNTFVISHPSASFLASADLTSTNMAFNGDDAVALFHNTTMIDLIGKIGCDPGTAWTATAGLTTVAKTLVRKPVYCTGIRTNPSATCGTAAFSTLSTEWTAYGAGTYAYLGSHTSNCGGVDISSVTLSPATSPICLGSSGYPITVNYALTGTFSANNQFVAELSSANGSFSSGNTIIGTAASASATSISATIPANTAAGTKYRIRIIATDPSTTGPNNGSDLVITAAAPNVTSLTAVANGQNLRVTWVNPTNCFDEVMVVATTANSVTATPSGTGSTYISNANYGSGFLIGTNQYVVYKGTATTITVSGLTENTAYQFKVFSRLGSTWSIGAIVNTTSPASISGNLFRTRASTSGNWNSTSLWMISTDGGASFANTTSNPSSASSSVLITSGSTVTISTTITIDEVLIASGGKLICNVAYTINNGPGDDLIIEGTYVHNNAGTTGLSVPTVNSGAMIRVREGGIIEVPSAIGGKGDAFANNESGDNLNGKIIYEPNSIFYWNISSAFSTSGVEYFPTGMAPNGKPIMRINGSFSVGATAATNFNAVVEVMSGKTLTLTGTGDKNFSFGIAGAGAIANNGGPIKITGADSEFSIASITSTSTGTIEISSGALATCNRNVAFGTGSHILNIVGTLDAQSFAITSTNLSLNLQGGTIRTSNPLGLDGVTGATFRNTTGTLAFYVAGNLGTVDFDALGNQSIQLTNATAINLPNVRLSGSGNKTLNFASTANIFGNLTLAENAVLASNANQTLSLRSNVTIQDAAEMASSCFDRLSLTLVGNTTTQSLISNNNAIRCYQLTASKTTGTISLGAGTTPLTLANGLSLSFSGAGSFTDNGNSITVQQGNIALSGVATNYNLTGSLLLTQSAISPGSYSLYGTTNTTSPAANLNNVIITPAPTGSTTFNLAPLAGGGTTTINGNFAVSNDGPLQLNFNGNYLTLRGYCDWQNDPARFSWGTGSTVKFERSPAVTLSNWVPHSLKQGSTAYSFRAIVLDGTSPVGFDGDWSAEDLTITGTAALQAQDNNITISNSISLAGTASLVPETSTFTFSKAGAQSIGVTGGVNFNHLVLAGSGTKSISSNLNLTGDLSVTGSATLVGGDKTITIGGNASFYGPSAFAANTSTILFNGNSQQVLISPSGLTVNNLMLSNSSARTSNDDLLLNNNLIVSNDLTLTQGNLSTGPNTITLGGNLTGESSTKRVWGNLASERTLTLGNSSTFGGLGLTVTSGGAAMGATQVVRHLGAGVTIGEQSSILRQYEIHPSTNSGLAATLVINYFEDELNGLNENKLKLFRKPASGSYLQQTASSNNPSTNTLTMTGIAAFSDWTATEEQVVLPVDLLRLSVHRQGSQQIISWVVGPESNLSHYTVERSQDGRTFEPIGQVPANGSQTYEYRDAMPAKQSIYYRLRMVDKDQSLKTSNPILLKTGLEEPQISIYPNPATDFLTISISQQDQLLGNSYSLVNTLGQLVWQGRLSQGTNQLNIHHLPQGHYTLVGNGGAWPLVK